MRRFDYIVQVVCETERDADIIMGSLIRNDEILDEHGRPIRYDLDYFEAEY